MTRNVVRDFVAARSEDELAIVTLSAEGERHTWSFGELVSAAATMAAGFEDRGVRRGTPVMTLVGSRIEYVLAILAGLWLGAPVLPCSEQLRPKDVALRLARARPGLVLCAARNRAALDAAAPDCPVITVPDESFDSAGAVASQLGLPGAGGVPAFAELDELDPSFVLFTSGTSGEPKLVTHGQRYVWGEQLQATEWLAPRPGELVWSTAAPGWSKSARNCFLAPWFGGAAALLEDRRFDPARRLATIRAERVDVLCMAPTEYRLIAASGPIGELPLRRAVTAGEPLGVAAFEAWRSQTGLEISDGYGQTETGQVTGVRPGETAPPGSMGRPLPGVRVEIAAGELTLDPSTLPTFFLGYDGGTVAEGMWHTGDQVRQDDDGWLFFVARTDDIILSAGYRIGPAEVEAALQSHPAVRECAALGLPDETRGQVVGAAIVLRDGFNGSPGLAAELQAHVRTETAPYKYPRRIWFVAELPKTTSGKVIRNELHPPE